MITADHKILNEEGESRLQHRCAIVLQDLATQMEKSKLHKKLLKV